MCYYNRQPTTNNRLLYITNNETFSWLFSSFSLFIIFIFLLIISIIFFLFPFLHSPFVHVKYILLFYGEFIFGLRHIVESVWTNRFVWQRNARIKYKVRYCYVLFFISPFRIFFFPLCSVLFYSVSLHFVLLVLTPPKCVNQIWAERSITNSQPTIYINLENSP